MTSSSATPEGAGNEGALKALGYAARLTVVIGVLTLFTPFGIDVMVFSDGTDRPPPFAVALLSAAGCFAAAALLKRRRRVAALVMALAFATPKIAAVAMGEPVRGNLLVAAAFLLVALNWKHLR